MHYYDFDNLGALKCVLSIKTPWFLLNYQHFFFKKFKHGHFKIKDQLNKLKSTYKIEKIKFIPKTTMYISQYFKILLLNP
ncbi:hypothetical protein FORMA_15740 [Formosa sp. Hel3_A1_48]|nr:hypothetical protein FORMA_15740 [Formosa sp. Hel3_A1_48]